MHTTPLTTVLKTGSTRAPTRTESIAKALEQDIVQGDLLPGHRLDEQVISRRFDTSRTPVREALRLLAASGLITVEPRIGAIVAQPTVGEIVELFELVGEMEAVAARLACERMTDYHRDAIFAAHDACRQAAEGDDADTYLIRNGAFHSAIHQAADNSALTSHIELINKRLAPYRRYITFRPERKETAGTEHAILAQALLAGDGDAASAAMRHHVRMLADDALILARSLRL